MLRRICNKDVKSRRRLKPKQFLYLPMNVVFGAWRTFESVIRKIIVLNDKLLFANNLLH